ncbi:uncharacterized protein LOC128274842 [Anopheles cruzii]|uniref:uncharacterized protein LOC128274842 n=1 Tax=Anopheles cruzii TaxID=68878 RepID=UPI0022EC1C0D|nr:uncharacterized protein LOC128274842 [Anopheles cruzii]
MKRSRATAIAAVLLYFAIVAGVAEAGFLDWFRSNKNKGHDVCRVDFEVLDPAGLRLWTAQKPDMKSFGVELFINPVRGKKPVSSFTQTTAEVKHGKFFLQTDDVIIKSGDILEYVIVTFNGDTTQRHKPRKLIVDDYMIKPKGRCSCPPSVAPPKPVDTVRQVMNDPATEVALLERILERVSKKCAEGIMSNYLFLQIDRVNGSTTDLKQYVVDYFTAKEALKPFADAVLAAEDGSDGIVFKVKGIIPKLKILEHARQDGDIIDYDKLTAVEDFDIRASFGDNPSK